MEIVQISEENRDSFLTLLGEDLSEDVRRVYFGGIGAVDDYDRALGALVYELLNTESEDDIEGRIRFAKCENQEILQVLGDYYTETTVDEEEIRTSSYELEEEESAKEFAGAGFTLEKKQCDTIRTTLGELSAVAALVKKLPGYVNSIGNLTLRQYREAVKEILFKGHKGVMDDIAYLPMSWFDEGISSCVISGDKVNGLFLIRRTPSGALIPALLFAYGPEFKKNLMYMIGYSVREALANYPSDTSVLIIRKDAGARALAGKLVPDTAETEIFFGTRQERA